jgi:hypothetical protein
MMINDIPSPGAIKPSSITSAIVNTDNSMNEFMLRMVNLSDTGVFHEPSCPICSSDHRNKAERMWIDTRNAASIQQFFIDKGKKGLSIPIIKNHMESHLDQSQDEIRRREYLEKLIAINDSGKVSTIDRIDMALTALNERLVAINAVADQTKPISEVEKIKSDTTCKITGSMDKLFKLRAEMLGEMKRDGEAFSINKMEFVNMFKSLLEASPTEEERLVVNKVFNELHKICREE